MVSNLGITKDNEMLKIRPPVDLLGGFFNIPTFDTSLLLDLKRQFHEIFCFWFFNESVPPQPQSIPLRPFQIFFKNSRRYSQFKVHHRYQQQWWQIATGINDVGGKFFHQFC